MIGTGVHACELATALAMVRQRSRTSIIEGTRSTVGNHRAAATNPSGAGGARLYAISIPVISGPIAMSGQAKIPD